MQQIIQYIYDLTDEMGEHIDGITSSLCMFIDVGVPIIWFVQKHGTNSLLNLSTVATFFLAVTAMTGIDYAVFLPAGTQHCL